MINIDSNQLIKAISSYFEYDPEELLVLCKSNIKYDRTKSKIKWNTILQNNKQFFQEIDNDVEAATIKCDNGIIYIRNHNNLYQKYDDSDREKVMIYLTLFKGWIMNNTVLQKYVEIHTTKDRLDYIFNMKNVSTKFVNDMKNISHNPSVKESAQVYQIPRHIISGYTTKEFNVTKYVNLLGMDFISNTYFLQYKLYNIWKRKMLGLEERNLSPPDTPVFKNMISKDIKTHNEGACNSARNVNQMFDKYAPYAVRNNVQNKNINDSLNSTSKNISSQAKIPTSARNINSTSSVQNKPLSNYVQNTTPRSTTSNIASNTTLNITPRSTTSNIASNVMSNATSKNNTVTNTSDNLHKTISNINAKNNTSNNHSNNMLNSTYKSIINPPSNTATTYSTKNTVQNHSLNSTHNSQSKTQIKARSLSASNRTTFPKPPRQDASYSNSGCYLLQEESHRLKNDNIYKIGKAQNIKQRLVTSEGYRNASIICILEVKNEDACEKEIIKTFDKKFEKINFHEDGTRTLERYRGDIDMMRLLFIQICLKYI